MTGFQDDDKLDADVQPDESPEAETADLNLDVDETGSDSGAVSTTDAGERMSELDVDETASVSATASTTDADEILPVETLEIFDGPVVTKRPGGPLAKRDLHFIWMVDCSGSMVVDGKIEVVNNAIEEALPHMRDVADDNPHAKLLVRAIKFSTGAQWHVSQATAIEEFEWTPLVAEGVTDMGMAFKEVGGQLAVDVMPERALPPVLVLLSDGQPTDDYKAGLKYLMEQPWGKKAVRIAIAIGQDADYDSLQAFIGNVEFKPLPANNPERLVDLIKWASTAVVKSASAPVSQAPDEADDSANVQIPQPPPAMPATLDVW
jgi:uncharacterized protein YegL